MPIALIRPLITIARSKGYLTDITTKGSSRLKIKNSIINRLIGYKNRQISLEREKNRALIETNAILSAYVAMLVDGKESVRISRRLIRESIGRYTATVLPQGDDYVISVISAGGCRNQSNRESEAKYGEG